MKTPTILRPALIGLGLTFLSACTAGHVKPSDRDTSGTYDGVWIGTVNPPRAKREVLAGQWYMTCDWEKFEVYITVDDGMAQLGKLEGKTPVSKTGRFRVDVSSGPAGMQSGVMPGNSKFVEAFTGTLSEEKAGGKYIQFIPVHGTNGCNAPIQFRRYTETSS